MKRSTAGFGGLVSLLLMGASPGADDGPSSPAKGSGGAASEGTPSGSSSKGSAWGAASGGWRWYGPPYYVTIGPDGRPVVIYPTPPLVAVPVMVPYPVVVASGGPLGGPRPNVPVAPPAPVQAPANPPKGTGRGEALLTIGDRLFRAGNVKRAEERYEQAVRADPGSAEPRVRLAEVAVVRGRYAEAAERFREAVAADPGWLARSTNNVQVMYGEPREFDKTVARLESRLLVEPNDRDAWLVLGAQLYLSGQTRRAADVFLRMTDRKPDPALAAFLDASRPPGAGGK